MQHRFLLAVLLVLLPSSASATWSVVAVDRSTGLIVIASATCVNNDAAISASDRAGRRMIERQRG